MSVPNQEEHFEHFEATTFDGLHQIGDRLHDEYFDVDEICYNEKAGVLEIPFRRIFHSGPSRVLKNRRLYRVVEVDVLRCSLRFWSVAHYALHDREGIGSYSFNCFLYDEHQGLITFLGAPDFDLLISVDGIHAEYREIGYRGKCKITRGLFWDSDTGEVYGE